MVTYNWKKPPGNQIYAKHFDYDGIPIGSAYKVSDADSTVLMDGSNPKIASNGDGSVIIVWTDSRDDKKRIYGQRYNAEDSTIGSNFQINESDNKQLHPDVDASDSTGFAVVWTEFLGGDPDVYCQLFDKMGNKIRSAFVVNSENTIGYQSSPSIAMREDGSFIVVWRDDPEVDDIYGKRFSPDGEPLGDYFLVNDDEINSNRQPKVVALDGGEFIVVWEDYRDIYAQVFLSDGSKLGSNFKVTNDEVTLPPRVPSVSVADSVIVITWSDPRVEGEGYNIFASIYSTSGIIGLVSERDKIPNQFTLEQNYPNPFNAVTTIHYALPHSGEISLRIFNILGEEVGRLVDGIIPAGNHTVTWDASNVASGIYFYRLQSDDFVQTRKMILLR